MKLKELFNILISDKPSALIKEHESEIFEFIPELKNVKDLIKIMNGIYSMYMSIF